MRRHILLTFVIMFFLTFLINGEEPKIPPNPVLKAGDVEHFIQTFPKLTKDLKALGAEYEAKSGSITFPDALKANEKFQQILKQYGWDNNFFAKSTTILLGYSLVAYGNQLKNVTPELKKALKEIDSNPDLTPELKKQMRDSILTAQSALSQGGNTITNMLNIADLKLIQPFVVQLKAILESTK